MGRFTGVSRSVSDRNVRAPWGVIRIVPYLLLSVFFQMQAAAQGRSPSIPANQGVNKPPGVTFHVPGSGNLYFQPVFTVECWLRPRTSGLVVARDWYDCFRSDWSLKYDSARGRLGFVTCAPLAGEDCFWTSDNVMRNDAWQHLALSVDGPAGHGWIYINGNVVASFVFSPRPFDEPFAMLAWGGMYWVDWLSGLDADYDECRYWDHIRSENQIRRRMYGTLPQADRVGLMHYWMFCGNYADSSGHGLDLRLDPLDWWVRRPSIMEFPDTPIGLACGIGDRAILSIDALSMTIRCRSMPFEEATMTANNQGDEPLCIVSMAVTGTHRDEFTLLDPVSGPPGKIIAEHDSALFHIRFTPRGYGLRSAELLLACDAVNGPVLTFPLHGWNDSLGLIVPPIDFGLVPPDSPPVTRAITAMNFGRDSVMVTSMRCTHADPFHAISGLPALIEPGGSATVYLGFTPPGYPGCFFDSLFFLYEPFCDTLFALVRGATISPSAISGPAEVRTAIDICEPPKRDTSVFVKNTGLADIAVSRVTVINDSSFTVIAPVSFPAVIAPDSLLEIRLRFQPGSPGARFTNLTVSSNAGNTAALVIPWIGRKDSVELEPDSFSFGAWTPAQLPCSRSLIVSNRGTVAVRIDSAHLSPNQPFVLRGGLPVVIAAGIRAPLDLVFTDPLLNGHYSDTLTVFTTPSCGTLKVLVTGTRTSSPIISGPSIIELDAVSCGPSVRDTVIRISNIGASVLVIDTILISGHPDVAVPTVTPRSIAPGTSDTFRIRIATRAPGLKAATITFSNNSSNMRKYPITVSLPVGRVQLLADPVDFGTYTAGEFPRQTNMTIRNSGIVPVTIDSAWFRNASPFRIATVLPFTIPPNLTVPIDVGFSVPASQGTVTDTLSLLTDPSCAALEVEVRGARQLMPVLDTIPGQDFGTFLCEAPDRDTTILIRNSGRGDLHLSALSIAGNPAFAITRQPATPRTIRQGEVDSLIIRYQTATLGDHDATLTIVSDAENNSAFHIPLHGRRDLVQLVKNDVSFGTLQPAQFPASRTVSFVNNGSVSVTIADARFAGARPFSLDATLPFRILPGDSSILTILFNAPPTDGTYADSLELVSIPSCVPSRILVSGTQESAPGIDALSHYEFAPLLCSGTARDTLIPIRNTGMAVLHVQTAVVNGDQDFRLIPAFSPFTVAPGSYTMLRIGFMPLTTGTKYAELVISSDAANRPDLSISLTGRKDSTAMNAITQAQFDTVTVSNFPSLKNIAIGNRGNVPITITSILASWPFSCSGGIPTTIQPGMNAMIEMRFDNPGKDTSIIDSYTIISVPRCAAMIEQIGGTRLTATAVLEVGSVHAAPGARVDVPVILRSAQDLELAGVSGFSAFLRCNKSLLTPLFATVSTFEGADRVAGLQLPLIPGPEHVIAHIPFTVSLGDALSTPIVLERVTAVGGSASFRLLPGSFTLDDVCEEAGLRLVNTEGRFALLQNVPNPFISQTDIEYEIIEPGPVTLLVMDRLGRTVATPVDAALLPGRYRVRFDAYSLPSGIYTYVLQSGELLKARTMLVLK